MNISLANRPTSHSHSWKCQCPVLLATFVAIHIPRIVHDRNIDPKNTITHDQPNQNSALLIYEQFHTSWRAHLRKSLPQGSRDGDVCDQHWDNHIHKEMCACVYANTWIHKHGSNHQQTSVCVCVCGQQPIMPPIIQPRSQANVQILLTLAPFQV